MRRMGGWVSVLCDECVETPAVLLPNLLPDLLVVKSNKPASLPTVSVLTPNNTKNGHDNRDSDLRLNRSNFGQQNMQALYIEPVSKSCI